MTEDEAGLHDRVVRTGEDEIALRLTVRERAILRALVGDLEAVVGAPALTGDEDWFDEIDADGADVPDVPDVDGAEVEADDDGDPPDPDAAVRARLYPSAIPDDERADASFRRLVQRDLEGDRRARLAVVEATLNADTLDDGQADAWLHVLNDVRLVMGTRLGVTDDSEGQPFEPEDPDAAAKVVFAYVGWLLGQFVEVLAATLPEIPRAWDPGWSVSADDS